MKKVLALLTAALAFGAMAAVEKVAVVESADMNGLVKAATKSGELVGYPMLGALASGALASNPYSMALGPMREGASAYAVVYADTAVTDSDKVDPDFVVVWPVTRGKAAFVASNPGCKEADGVIAVAEIDDDDDDDDDEDAAAPSEPDYTYTAFSADEKWATSAPSAELARKGLEVVSSSMLAKDEFLHFAITPAGVAFAKELLTKNPGDFGGYNYKSIVEFVKVLSCFDAGIAITDEGLTLRANYIPVPGSALAASYQKPFESCPLGTFKPGAFIAFAANDGVCGADNMADYEKIVKAINEAGIKTDFLKTKCEDGRAEWTLDYAAFAKFMKDGGPKTVDEKALTEKFEKIQSEAADGLLKLSEKPQYFSFYLEGKSAPVAPAELFKAILPGIAAQKPCSVSVVAPAAFLLATAPDHIATLPEEIQTSVKPLLATLPTESKGGIVSACWRDGDKIASICRVSAEEIKTLAAIVNVFMATMMM